MVLPACDDGLHQSCVPWYVVSLEMNTREWYFNQLESWTSHIIVDDSGFHWQDKTLPLPLGTSPHGYMGVIVFNNGDGYLAFDMCCPNCYLEGRRKENKNMKPVELHSETDIYAICPTCGAEYDLSCYGAPHSGSREGLKRYNAYKMGDIIKVTN